MRNKIRTETKKVKRSFYKKALSPKKPKELWNTIHRILNPAPQSISADPDVFSKPAFHLNIPTSTTNPSELLRLHTSIHRLFTRLPARRWIRTSSCILQWGIEIVSFHEVRLLNWCGPNTSEVPQVKRGVYRLALNTYHKLLYFQPLLPQSMEKRPSLTNSQSWRPRGGRRLSPYCHPPLSFKGLMKDSC